MDHVYVIGIAQAVFSCAFFFLRKKKTHASLAAGTLMVFLALPMLSNLGATYFPSFETLWFVLMHSAPFAFGPFLYFYTDLMIDENPGYRKKYIYHLLPFVVVFIILLSGVKFYPPGAPSYEMGNEAGRGWSPDLLWVVKFVLANTSYITYTVVIFIKLGRHRKNIGEYFSNESSEITLVWLKILTIVFIASNIFMSVLVPLTPYLFTPDIFKPGLFVDYGLTFFIFAFSMFATRQPLIYEPLQITPGDEEFSPEKKYEKSGLKDEDVSVYLSAIEAHMEKEMPFLNSELTIDDISHQLGIKRHYITQILNNRLNLNFNNYVNNFRIRYITEKMKEEEFSDDTLLGLALDAGFNSKSTFNRVFKMITGITPSEFRGSVYKNKVSA